MCIVVIDDSYRSLISEVCVAQGITVFKKHKRVHWQDGRTSSGLAYSTMMFAFLVDPEQEQSFLLVHYHREIVVGES